MFSPEWANAADLENSRRIYEEMYAHLSASWVADGCFTHLVSMLANDHDGINGWHWLSFGMIAADAVRDLQPVQGCDADVDVRRACLEDVEQVMTLDEALWQHMAAPSIFLADAEERATERDRSYYEEWLQNPEKALWLAYHGTDAVAYMGLGPASDDASYIICDEKTTSIFGAFTREKARCSGIAMALLDRSLEWARAQGYERCAVDFEPMNPLATRFWLRHFEPVCSEWASSRCEHILPVEFDQQNRIGERRGDILVSNCQVRSEYAYGVSGSGVEEGGDTSDGG